MHAAAPSQMQPQEAAPALVPARTGPDRFAMLAVGLLLGILVVGGPMLYRNTWGASEHPQAAAPAAPAPIERARPAVPEAVDLQAENTDDKEPEATTQQTQRAAPKNTPARNTTAKPEPAAKPAAGGKNLSEEQLALLKRMGGGGNDPDLTGMRSKDDEQKPAGATQPTLTPPQLTKVVKDNTVQLQRCYETALRAAGGKQEGAIKVTVSVVVGMSGTTKSVSTQGDGLGNMTECIRSSVKRWRFPVSGGDSEFAFPLVFQPGA
jgi:pyruvate/2-oxoglutarate dehydrogenase complex dihydrolipoamide acyltransferase (E2) component